MTLLGIHIGIAIVLIIFALIYYANDQWEYDDVGERVGILLSILLMGSTWPFWLALGIVAGVPYGIIAFARAGWRTARAGRAYRPLPSCSTRCSR